MTKSIKTTSGDYLILVSGIIIGILLLIVCLISKKRKAVYYQKHKPILIDIHNKIAKMIPYFDKDEKNRLSKLKIQPDIKSYTINKHDMHLCLEDDNGSYYDDNLLIYVTLHELAHIFCDEIGHTENFYKIFNKLTDIAEKVKIYDSSISLPKEYCGITI